MPDGLQNSWLAWGCRITAKPLLATTKIAVISAVREASQRCRVLVTTGGLGPTPDDLTTEALAAAFETPLEERPELWLEIQRKLSAVAGRLLPATAARLISPGAPRFFPIQRGRLQG